MSLVYLLSKFSREAMVLEIFLISVLGLTLFGFYLFKRRRYGVAKDHIPDQVVKALLVEILSLTEGYKNQLFGVGSLPASAGVNASAIAGAAAKAAAALSAGSPLMAGAASGGDEALKAQMGAISAKNDELAKALQGLTAEKAALEEKLKAAGAGGGAAKGGDDAALAELKAKIANLEARLAEYEVIEDDLANLKRYQQENKQLKAQIDMMKGGAAAPAPAVAAPAPTPPPAAAAPAPAAPTPIAAAEAAAPAAPAPDFGDLAGKVDASIAAAPPAGGSVTDPAAIAKAQTAPASADTGAAAEQKPAGDAPKSDSDLLSEFEKMLSS